jgi:hypothetical protein
MNQRTDPRDLPNRKLALFCCQPEAVRLSSTSETALLTVSSLVGVQNSLGILVGFVVLYVRCADNSPSITHAGQKPEKLLNFTTYKPLRSG